MAAGADIFVLGSALFSADDPGIVIKKINEILV